MQTITKELMNDGMTIFRVGRIAVRNARKGLTVITGEFSLKCVTMRDYKKKYFHNDITVSGNRKCVDSSPIEVPEEYADIINFKECERRQK